MKASKVKLIGRDFVSYGHYRLTVENATGETVDSAMMLLPYFRDRLIYNSKKGYWEIETRKGLFHSREK